MWLLYSNIDIVRICDVSAMGLYGLWQESNLRPWESGAAL